MKALLVQSGEPITKYDNGGRDTVEPTSDLSSTPDMYQVLVTSDRISTDVVRVGVRPCFVEEYLTTFWGRG